VCQYLQCFLFVRTQHYCVFLLIDLRIVLLKILSTKIEWAYNTTLLAYIFFIYPKQHRPVLVSALHDFVIIQPQPFFLSSYFMFFIPISCIGTNRMWLHETSSVYTCNSILNYTSKNNRVYLYVILEHSNRGKNRYPSVTPVLPQITLFPRMEQF